MKNITFHISGPTPWTVLSAARELCATLQGRTGPLVREGDEWGVDVYVRVSPPASGEALAA